MFKIINWFKTNKWLLLVIAILVILLVVFINAYANQKHEKTIWKQNTEAALSKIEIYKINDSIQVVKIDGLVMSLNDAEIMNKKLVNQVKQLNVKNNELSALIAIHQEQMLQNPDTIYVPITLPTDTTARQLNAAYNDKWIDAKIQIDDYGDKAIILPNGLQWQSRDSVYVVPTINWKGYWFWKRAIGVQLHMFNSNPHTKIVGAQYIELKKPKKAHKLTE